MNRVRQLVDQARAEGREILSEHESKTVLKSYGIPVSEEVLVSREEELKQALANLPFPYPIVMKVDSPDIPHKTEAGVIKLNVPSAEAAVNHYHELLEKARHYNPAARINGVLLQEMVQGAVAECIVGMIHDFQFGPVIMYGSGGIFVEVFEDVTFRIPPFDEAEALRMLQETKGYKLLRGFRGRPAADVGSLVSVLTNMSALAMDCGNAIAELDLNPVLVLKEGFGVKVVDALIRLRAQNAA